MKLPSRDHVVHERFFVVVDCPILELAIVHRCGEECLRRGIRNVSTTFLKGSVHDRRVEYPKAA